MKGNLNSVLLRWADGRLLWATLHRPPEQRLPPWFPLIPAATGLLVFGLPFLLLGRALHHDWSFWAFWIPGSFGMVAGLLAGAMGWIAWNRRAAEFTKGGEAISPVRRLTPFQRWLLQPLLVLVIMATAFAVVTGIENRRGDRALKAYQADLRARGEPVTFSDLVPSAVPESANLAMAPVLRPLFEYERVSPHPGQPAIDIRWKDSNAVARLREVATEDPRVRFESFAKKTERRSGSWREGERIDLTLWQDYYRSLTNWPQAPEGSTPGKVVLAALGRHDSVLRELREASAARPEFQFPTDANDLFAPLEHFSILKSLVSVLRLRAVAFLSEQRADEALQDVRLAFKLASGCSRDHRLISQLVALALDQAVLQPVWEGCLTHTWNASQLADLQAMLEGRDHLHEMQQAMRGERVLAEQVFDAMARGGPTAAGSSNGAPPAGPGNLHWLLNRGWMLQNRVVYGRFVDSIVRDLGSAKSHKALPTAKARQEELIGKRSLFNILAALLAPAIASVQEKAYTAETNRRMALVAIALERWRLAHGNYPAQLADLTPEFIAAPMVIDPMVGEALRYSASDGSYRLYSVGLDHTDNSGERGERRGGRDARPSGDLVWK